jgi:transposase InsO family protein
VARRSLASRRDAIERSLAATVPVELAHKLAAIGAPQRECRRSTRTRRLALIAGYADAYERKPPMPPPERHIEAVKSGEIIGVDCFYVGRLSGTKGTVLQYTAIDVASGFAWAQLHSSQRNPLAQHTRSLVHRVTSELAAAGWRLKAVISGNGSEFRSKQFTAELQRLGVQH